MDPKFCRTKENIYSFVSGTVSLVLNEVLFLVICAGQEIYFDYFPYCSLFSDKTKILFSKIKMILVVYLQFEFKEIIFVSKCRLIQIFSGLSLVSQNTLHLPLRLSNAIEIQCQKLTILAHVYIFVFQSVELKPKVITKVHATNATRLRFFSLGKLLFNLRRRSRHDCQS